MERNLAADASIVRNKSFELTVNIILHSYEFKSDKIERNAVKSLKMNKVQIDD